MIDFILSQNIASVDAINQWIVEHGINESQHHRIHTFLTNPESFYNRYCHSLVKFATREKRFLDLLHAVPEGGAVCKLWRGVGRQHDLRMDNAAFPGVVVGHAVPFICQLGSAAVSSCGNSRTACAALDDTDGDMTEIYGEHLLSVRG